MCMQRKCELLCECLYTCEVCISLHMECVHMSMRRVTYGLYVLTLSILYVYMEFMHVCIWSVLIMMNMHMKCVWKYLCVGFQECIITCSYLSSWFLYTSNYFFISTFLTLILEVTQGKSLQFWKLSKYSCFLSHNINLRKGLWF